MLTSFALVASGKRSDPGLAWILPPSEARPDRREALRRDPRERGPQRASSFVLSTARFALRAPGFWSLGHFVPGSGPPEGRIGSLASLEKEGPPSGRNVRAGGRARHAHAIRARERLREAREFAVGQLTGKLGQKRRSGSRGSSTANARGELNGKSRIALWPTANRTSRRAQRQKPHSPMANGKSHEPTSSPANRRIGAHYATFG